MSLKAEYVHVQFPTVGFMVRKWDWCLFSNGTCIYKDNEDGALLIPVIIMHTHGALIILNIVHDENI